MNQSACLCMDTVTSDRDFRAPEHGSSQALSIGVQCIEGLSLRGHAVWVQWARIAS